MSNTQRHETPVERLIPLKEIPKLLPRRRGKKIHYQTVWRWSKKGARGVVLETTRVGHIRYTSHEALKRFLKSHSPGTQIGSYHDAIEAELNKALTGSPQPV